MNRRLILCLAATLVAVAIATACLLVSSERDADASWNVTVRKDGKAIASTKLSCDGSNFDLARRVHGLVDAHITTGPSPRSAEITLWRSYSMPFESTSLNEKAAKAGKHITATYTQTEAVGPVYAQTDDDGYVRVYQEDTPGSPEIMAEGRQMDFDLMRSIIARVLADRLADAVRFTPTTKKPR